MGQLVVKRHVYAKLREVCAKLLNLLIFMPYLVPGTGVEPVQKLPFDGF